MQHTPAGTTVEITETKLVQTTTTLGKKPNIRLGERRENTIVAKGEEKRKRSRKKQRRRKRRS